MFKRIITLALAVVCLASFAVLCVNAEENMAVVTFEDGTTVEVKVGDTFKYSVCVGTPDAQVAEDMQGFITYDAAALKVLSATSPAAAGAIINTGEAGTIYFNATDVNKGINFFRQAALTVEFEVIAAAEIATPAYTFEEMTQLNGDSYFTNSEKVNADVDVWADYNFPVYEEETTATEPETEATTAVVEPTATAPVAPETNVTGATEAPVTPDIPTTGANVAIFAAIAVVAMAGAAVVVLRKRVNG